MVDAETTRAISCEGILSGRIDANDILIESVGNETKKKVVLNREFDALSGKFKTVENIESLQVVQLSTISEYADVSSTVGILSNAIYFVEEDPMAEYQQTVARDAGISYEYLKNNLTTGITVEQMITSLLPVLSSLANMK